jgi:methyltransferase (TIGR00027 family)
MEAEAFESVGITALGLAASRGVESSREDRLIDDPYARALFDAAGATLPMRTRWPASGDCPTDVEALHLHGSRYIGVRTRFYDDIVVGAAAQAVGQAVLVGAGLDTRVLRLALPRGFETFELDRGPLLRFKRQTLSRLGVRPLNAVTDIATDLADDWAERLLASGFSPDAPAVWIAEGLVPYLDGDGQAALIAAMDELSAPGSVVAFDRITGGDTAELARRSGIAMDELLVEKTAGADLAELLEQRGWAAEAADVATVAERYRRDLSDPFASGDAGPASAPPWLETEFTRARKLPGVRPS